MKKFLFFALLSMLIGFGCVAVEPAPKDLVNSLKQKESISICYYSSFPLSITTVKSIAGNGLAAKFSKSEDVPYGSALMETYKIKNPMEQVAQNVVSGLLNNGITNINFVKAPYKLNDKKNQPGYDFDTDYLLILKPLGFDAHYMPLNWQTYRVGLAAEAVLIRLKDKQQVWRGVGAGDGALDKRMRLDVTEFEKNEAKRLKEVIDVCVTKCSDEIIGHFLNKKKK